MIKYITLAVSKIGKLFTGPTCKLLSSCFICFYILYSIYTKYTLSKAVPDEFHGSDGQSKRNCLQDRANFHRSLENER